MLSYCNYKRFLGFALVLPALWMGLSCAQLVEPDLTSLDQDGDGFIDALDDFPLDPNEWADTDNDGIGDNADPDIDGDGVLNGDDAFPNNATETLDTDNDGIGDNADTDDDNDGVLDVNDVDPTNPNSHTDTDGDGIPDEIDDDKDGDGVANDSDACPLDSTETVDTDGDGTCNVADTDDDGDGIEDSVDDCPLDATGSVDSNSDGTCSADTDGDGVEDTSDAFPNDATETVDTDGDGVGDNADCDDTDTAIHTNAHEICDNAVDEDCDSSTTEFDCMIAITGGTFDMGPDNDGDFDSTNTDDVAGTHSPLHDVTITSFHLDKYEVTNALYSACVTAGNCTAPDASSNYTNTDIASRPVTFVSWAQADTFCTAAGKRLPTESEWEYAARNASTTAQGSETKYPWGDTPDPPTSTEANLFHGAELGTLVNVNSLAGGDSGDLIYNLIGNVAEWVSDFAGDYPDSDDATVTDPTGPENNQTTNKVYRGGSFASTPSATPADGIEATDRFDRDPSDQTFIGFRCADSNAVKN